MVTQGEYFLFLANKFENKWEKSVTVSGTAGRSPMFAWGSWGAPTRVPRRGVGRSPTTLQYRDGNKDKPLKISDMVC